MVLVTAGVIVRNGRLLVCQRPAGGYHPLKWEFPGGKCRVRETPEQGLRRELREELGIDAEVGRELWRTRHQYEGREPFELRFFLVPAYRGAIARNAFAALGWLPIPELPALDLLDGDRDFVAHLVCGEIALTCLRDDL